MVAMELDYDWEEEEPGRKLGDIIRFTSQYAALPPSGKAWVEGLYQQVALARFVLSANLSEETGLADFYSTLQVLQSPHHPRSQEERETAQMGAAMQVLREVREEMRQEELNSRWEVLTLTSDIVQDAHGVMMHGVLHDAGKMRTALALTGLPGGKCHEYPAPETLSWQLLSAFDRYNLALRRVSDNPTAAIPQLYRLAAALFVQFVSVHPFSDGNGRLSRILASHVLSAVTPFPVTPHANGSSENRQLFLKAIRSSAESSLPRDFAAMLVQAGWTSWHVCFQSLERHALGTALHGLRIADIQQEVSEAMVSSKDLDEWTSTTFQALPELSVKGQSEPFQELRFSWESSSNRPHTRFWGIQRDV